MGKLTIKGFGKANAKQRNVIAVLTNDTFTQLDLLERRITDLECEMRAANMEMEFDSVRHFNRIKAECKYFTSMVAPFGDEFAEGFGSNADCLDALQLLILSRCGGDQMLLYKIAEYIKSFPEKMAVLPEGQLDKRIDQAFEHLFGYRKHGR